MYTWLTKAAAKFEIWNMHNGINLWWYILKTGEQIRMMYYWQWVTQANSEKEIRVLLSGVWMLYHWATGDYQKRYLEATWYYWSQLFCEIVIH